MHGIELEKLIASDGITVEYIVPFVGREVPWWSGLTLNSKKAHTVPKVRGQVGNKQNICFELTQPQLCVLP